MDESLSLDSTKKGEGKYLKFRIKIDKGTESAVAGWQLVPFQGIWERVLRVKMQNLFLISEQGTTFPYPPI